MKIYGPVPSWRLGNSLGVDLVEAPKNYSKICSYNCIYCQLGYNGFKVNRPRKFGINEKDFILLRKKIKETRPDYVTFSGEGEPTINLDLGYVATRIKQMTDIPIAVLTNSSFINNNLVRQGLNKCDLVIAKVDASNQRLFEKINNVKEIKLMDIINGIKLIKTKVAIQTLLFSYNKLTNSNKKNIDGLIKIYKEIHNKKPITIFLGTAYRPTDNVKLKAISINKLKEIAFRITRETGIEVIHYKRREPKAVLRKLDTKELKKEILELLKRRPCTEKELYTRFGNIDLSEMLSVLSQKRIIGKRVKNKEVYYFSKS